MESEKTKPICFMNLKNLVDEINENSQLTIRYLCLLIKLFQKIISLNKFSLIKNLSLLQKNANIPILGTTLFEIVKPFIIKILNNLDFGQYSPDRDMAKNIQEAFANDRDIRNTIDICHDISFL